MKCGRYTLDRPAIGPYRSRPVNPEPLITMKTVLITGCSSGYGLASARHFLAQGWNVIATMRQPRPDLLPESPRLRVLPLDVTDPDSIARAVALAGPIDVLVNNAGIGLFGAFEATPMATTREVFETNTFGPMAMAQAVLPQWRARRAGVLVNVSSSATLAPMPLVAVYTASKTALQGFTASLAFELAAFGVRAKLVEPGYGPDTRFAANGAQRMAGLIPEAYAPFAQGVFKAFTQVDRFTTGTDVAQAVWDAATDGSDRLHYPAGDDARALALSAAAA
jgi:NAD(P)-dependent dehydrogenase (short-subunit alcohol dehydrogenase family)